MSPALTKKNSVFSPHRVYVSVSVALRGGGGAAIFPPNKIRTIESEIYFCVVETENSYLTLMTFGLHSSSFSVLFKLSLAEG